MLVTCTVIGFGNGLLSTSTGCSDPAFSLTLYTDWLNIRVVTAKYTKLLQYLTKYDYNNYHLMINIK